MVDGLLQRKNLLSNIYYFYFLLRSSRLLVLYVRKIIKNGFS